MRLYPPGSDEPFDDTRLKRFARVDMEHVFSNIEKQVYLLDRLG